MRRRVLFGLVVIAIVVAARFLFVRPVEARLELSFGASAPTVRAVALVFTDASDHVQRQLDLSYPTGAPPVDHRALKLHPGDYTVGARVDRDGAPQRTFNLPLHVAEAGTYTLDLAPSLAP
jgi:hypothetical protein